MYPAGCLPCCHICSKGELGFSPVSLYALPWLVEAQTEFLFLSTSTLLTVPPHSPTSCQIESLCSGCLLGLFTNLLSNPPPVKLSLCVKPIIGNHGRLRSIKISYSSP
jgi:hypothetical protein